MICDMLDRNENTFGNAAEPSSKCNVWHFSLRHNHYTSMPSVKNQIFSTHRESKTYVNLGNGHLFLLAQVQKQLVLQKVRGALNIKSQTTIQSK